MTTTVPRQDMKGTACHVLSTSYPVTVVVMYLSSIVLSAGHQGEKTIV